VTTLDELSFMLPWEPVDDGSGLEAELAKEIGKLHPLYGKTLRAVAKRIDRDDVIFAGPDCVALVHLTWSSKQETDPRWPSTYVFTSIDELAGQLAEDIEDYKPSST
jgi:hypothetical protein